MTEELQENLKTYKLQLQQVEASLTTDPDNEDLQKLHNDLQEVIDLTVDLISGQIVTTDATDQSSQPGGAASSEIPSYNWSVGDKCSAPFSEDGLYYEGLIEEILDNGSCTITFEAYGNTDVTQLCLLKSVEAASAKSGSDNKLNKSKKDLISEQREYKRKKSQKKAQRLRQLEEERESEKNKWLTFNAKTFSKTSKGKVKKSIFATSDHVKGKVGVGTCGVSGRPMTTYKGGEKWRK